MAKVARGRCNVADLLVAAGGTTVGPIQPTVRVGSHSQINRAAHADPGVRSWRELRWEKWGGERQMPASCLGCKTFSL